MSIIKVNLDPIYKFVYNELSNYRFTFTLLDGENRVIFTPVQCKDYITDVFYSEYMERPLSLYGLNWKPGRLDIKVKTFKMLIDGETENMEEKIEHIESFINAFGKAIKIPNCKIWKTDSSNRIIIEFSNKWTSNNLLVSLFCTLIRISGAYKKGMEPLEYLIAIRKQGNYIGYPNYMKPEISRIGVLLGRFAAVLSGKKPNVKRQKNVEDISNVHHEGMYGGKNFPYIEVKI